MTHSALTDRTPASYPLFAKRESFADQLEKYINGRLTGSAPLTIGGTPEVLKLLGAADLPVIITKSAIDKILHNKHGLPIGLLRQLPEKMADPIMVFDSATEKNSLVVMTELQHEGKTVVAAVHLNRMHQHHEVNRVASLYGKDRNEIFKQWIEEGLLRYQHKQKSRHWFQSRGLQLPKEGTASGLSTNRILTENDLVKSYQGPLFSKATPAARVAQRWWGCGWKVGPENIGAERARLRFH